MANISDAHGTIKFKTKTKEDMVFLLDVFKLLEYGEYYTDLIQDIGDLEKNLVNEDGHVTYRCYFEANGRWVYQENIEYCFLWIKNGLEHFNRLSDYERLVNTEFSIVYDFVDFECGVMVLYHAVIEVEHKAGVPLEKTKPKTIEKDDYEFTIQNILDITGEDYEYVLNYFGLLEGGYENEHSRYQFRCPDCLEKLEYINGEYICPKCNKMSEPLDAKLYDLIDKEYV